MSIAYYFCRTGYSITTTDLNHQRASPIAITNPSSQAADDQPPVAGKRGLDEGLLSTYPKVMYSQVKLQYGNLTGSCCSICLADYKDNEMLLLLPDCAHLFHVKCGNDWLRLHPTCPVCRKSPISSSVPVSQLAPDQLLFPDPDGSVRENLELNDHVV